MNPGLAFRSWMLPSRFMDRLVATKAEQHAYNQLGSTTAKRQHCSTPRYESALNNQWDWQISTWCTAKDLWCRLTGNLGGDRGRRGDLLPSRIYKLHGRLGKQKLGSGFSKSKGSFLPSTSYRLIVFKITVVVTIESSENRLSMCSPAWFQTTTLPQKQNRFLIVLHVHLQMWAFRRNCSLPIRSWTLYINKPLLITTRNETCRQNKRLQQIPDTTP